MVPLPAHFTQIGKLPVFEALGIGQGRGSSSREISARSAAHDIRFSSAAICSPRTSELPRGIITAASQRSTASAPRSAWRREIPARAAGRVMRPSGYFTSTGT